MCWTPCFFFLSNKTLGGACITRDVPPIRQSQARPQSFPSNPCPALCSVFYSLSPSLLSPLPLLLPSPSSFAPLTFSFPLLFHPFLLYSLLTHSTPIALSHHCRPSFATPSTVTFLFSFPSHHRSTPKDKKKKRNYIRSPSARPSPPPLLPSPFTFSLFFFRHYSFAAAYTHTRHLLHFTSSPSNNDTNINPIPHQTPTQW